MEDLTPEHQESDTVGEGPRVDLSGSDQPALPEVVDSSRSYSVDPVSGFVESGHQGASLLPADKKVLFLEFFRRFWPNVTRACLMSGLSYKTYKQHLELDTKFKQACEDIKREVLDELEGLGTQFAKSPKGFMHWIAILKAHRPERWSPDQRIVIQHELAPEQVRIKRDNLAQVIAQDAEVIEATTGHKPPVIPDFKPPDPEPEAIPPNNPEQASNDLEVALTAPQVAQENPPPTLDNANEAGSFDSQLLDSAENPGNTYGAEDMDISKLIEGRKLPPKKPTGGLISTDPQAPSPSAKSNGPGVD